MRSESGGRRPKEATKAQLQRLRAVEATGAKSYYKLFRLTMAHLATFTKETTLEAWEQRLPVFRQFSPGYMTTQTHMLPFLDMEPTERYLVFQDISELLAWTASSRLRYWKALGTAAWALQRAVTPSDTAFGTQLSRDARTEADSSTIPLSWEDFIRAVSLLREPEHTKTLVVLRLAFQLGQRVGDVLRLRRKDIKIEEQSTYAERFITFIFREGKTIRRTRPYCLHLPLDTPAGQCLAQLISTNSEAGSEYLFLTDAKLIALQLRQTLHSLSGVQELYTLRSPRKGGLQHMVRSGMALSEVLMFSRHTSVETLEIYLDFGRANPQPILALMQTNMLSI